MRVRLPEDTPLLVFQETVQNTAQLLAVETVVNTGSILIFQISPGIECEAPNFDAIEKAACPVADQAGGPTTLPFVSYCTSSPDLLPTTVDQYMSHKLHSLEAVLYEAGDARTAVATIRFPANLVWTALKGLIAMAIRQLYDPERIRCACTGATR